jgi:hypothetical protein
MEQTEELTLQRFKETKLLRVLFFDSKGEGVSERIMHRAVADYSKMFQYSGLVTHCAVVLGDTYYEVALDESVRMPFDESMLLAAEVVGHYAISLEGMEDEDLLAAKFMLDQDIISNRRFNPWQCFTFLENYLRMRIDNWCNLTGLLPFFDFTLTPGTFKRRMGDIGFHLPYTCASQVAYVFNMLFDMEPSYDCHLPEAMFCNLEQLALTGYGEFFVKDYLGVM